MVFEGGAHFSGLHFRTLSSVTFFGHFALKFGGLPLCPPPGGGGVRHGGQSPADHGAGRQVQLPGPGGEPRGHPAGERRHHRPLCQGVRCSSILHIHSVGIEYFFEVGCTTRITIPIFFLFSFSNIGRISILSSFVFNAGLFRYSFLFVFESPLVIIPGICKVFFCGFPPFPQVHNWSIKISPQSPLPLPPISADLLAPFLEPLRGQKMVLQNEAIFFFKTQKQCYFWRVGKRITQAQKRFFFENNQLCVLSSSSGRPRRLLEHGGWKNGF